VLPEGRPPSNAHASNALPLSTWTGDLNRGTWILAAPIDCDGIARAELAVAATAGELCLLKTRDLVYNLIGDKWNVILYNYYNFPLNMQATLKQKLLSRD
jgi:hypothetical protein